MRRTHLRLFIAGSRRAGALDHDALAVMRSLLGEDALIEIVDVEQDAEAAERNRVLATPTLDRVEPWPPRRHVGALDDVRRALSYLELLPPD